MFQDAKRVYSIDLARGLAVFFMICIHVLITYGAPNVWYSPFGHIIGFLGSPTAAPVFMALMGMSFYYSRNTDMMLGIKRGFKIILLGYVLNLLRGVLPVLLVKEAYPSRIPAIPEPVMDWNDAFFELDILQFAGLALIVMALIRRFKVNKYYLLASALAVAIVSPYLWPIQCNIPVIGHMLDFLWGNRPSTEDCIGNLVSFPFFPWFTYVLLGMFLGDTLTKSSCDMRKVFNYCGIAGLLILSASALYFLTIGDFMKELGDYYHSSAQIVIFTCGIILGWLWFCNFIVEKVKMNKLFELIFYWSKNVNSIYIRACPQKCKELKMREMPIA